MRTKKKLFVSTAFLTMAAVIGAIELTSEQKEELITNDMQGVDLMSYYTKQDDHEFTLHDVYMRRDANFMQGFYYDVARKQFVESAGLYGISKVEWLTQSNENDRVEEQDPHTNVYNLDESLFGEGLSPRNADEFIVLTWQERKMLILDRNTLELKEEFTMPSDISQGWGVTAVETDISDDGNYRLYVSDGTTRIFEVDGDNMEILNTLTVKDKNNNEKNNINELEYVNGYIYANVWYEDVIIKIDPETGVIDDSWDISSLAQAENAFQIENKGYTAQDCLNGIAYNPDTHRFYLTGKKHHLIFEVTLDRAP